MITFYTFTEAPLCKSNSTISTLPVYAATIRKVFPSFNFSLIGKFGLLAKTSSNYFI